MFAKARHLLSRPYGRRGLAGGGLFDRMRATTFALLGGTAAFCLALVALLSQQGVPYLPALPIPGAGGGDEAVSNGSVVARDEDSVRVRIPPPAGVPAGPDRIPTFVSGGADSPSSNSNPDSAGPNQVASVPPASSSPVDNGSSGGGQQPGSGTPSPPSPPQSSPVSNPAPGGSNGSSGSQSGSGGNAEADAVSAAGGGGGAKPSKPTGTPPTTATTAAQQAAAPPAAAPPAPAPSSPAAAEEAAAEEAAASP